MCFCVRSLGFLSFYHVITTICWLPFTQVTLYCIKQYPECRKKQTLSILLIAEEKKRHRREEGKWGVQMKPRCQVSNKPRTQQARERGLRCGWLQLGIFLTLQACSCLRKLHLGVHLELVEKHNKGPMGKGSQLKRPWTKKQEILVLSMVLLLPWSVTLGMSLSFPEPQLLPTTKQRCPKLPLISPSMQKFTDHPKYKHSGSK